jgi:hypothetical protein
VAKQQWNYNFIAYNFSNFHATNLKVLSVSSKFTSAGLRAAIIAVLELPPNDSFKSQVSTES